MAAAHKKVASHFFLQFCVPTIFRNASLLLLFDRNVRCCSRLSVQQPLHASDLMGGANAIDKRRVYGLPVAMNVARFHCGKLEYGRSGCIFAYISMTTRARDFKFAGTPVQRLQLAMVALTQKSFLAQYAWFLVEGHI